MTEIVYAFCRESGQRFFPAIGRGAGQQHNRTTQTGSTVRCVGVGYHACWLPEQQMNLVEMDADHWKTWVHQRLGTPLDKPGAMTLFRAQPSERLSLARHLTAEVKTEEFVAGKGVVIKWERIRRDNHWFDALYNCCVAGHGAGVRLVDEPAAPAANETADTAYINPAEAQLDADQAVVSAISDAHQFEVLPSKR